MARTTAIKDKPLASILRWPGGKVKACKRILSMFPESAKEYREPFLGGGSVFLAAHSLGFAEKYWLNDLDEDLIAFWQFIQGDEYRKLVERLMSIKSIYDIRMLRDLHSQLKENSHQYLSHFDRAFKLFFLNRVSFSGTTKMGGFSKESAKDRFNMSSIKKLHDLHLVLDNVAITNTQFDICLKRGGDDVFIYLDPPYYVPKGLYPASVDPEYLAQSLRSCGHKFLMTYDDCPEIRKMYSWANIQPFDLQYSMVGVDKNKRRRRGQELFIFNYDPSGEQGCLI